MGTGYKQLIFFFFFARTAVAAADDIVVIRVHVTSMTLSLDILRSLGYFILFLFNSSFISQPQQLQETSTVCYCFNYRWALFILGVLDAIGR